MTVTADRQYDFAARGYAVANVSVIAGSVEEAEARVWEALGCGEVPEGEEYDEQEGKFRLVAANGTGFIECAFAGETVSIRRARGLEKDGTWTEVLGGGER